jgi:hypothetical protein
MLEEEPSTVSRTQEQWKAITGADAGRHKGASNPVEQKVSLVGMLCSPCFNVPVFSGSVACRVLTGSLVLCHG